MFNQNITSENLCHPMYKIHRCVDSPDTITEEKRKREEDIKLRNEQCRNTKLRDCVQRENLADLDAAYDAGYSDGYDAGYDDGRLTANDKSWALGYDEGYSDGINYNETSMS